MKRQASFKEYTVSIADSGSAEVYKLFKNAHKGLQELCAANNLDCPKGYAAGTLGNRILKELNGGDANATSAVAGHYIISREPNDSIKVSKIYKNTSGALRELSELVDFDYDAKWGPRTFGNKVIDAIESGEFKKLAKVKKIEDTVEIEMDEEIAVEAAPPQVVAQEIPADAVLLEPEDPSEIGNSEFENNEFTCVIVPDGVKAIENFGFYECKNLQRVILPEGLEEIGSGVFYGCSELAEINIPASVTKIDDRAFKDCENLQKVILPEGLEGICSEVFSNCTKLTEINIPAGVTVIGFEAFHNCENLQSIILPDGLEEIKMNAFYGCSELAEINIPASVTKIEGSAFDGCDKLDLGAIYKFEDGVAYNKDKTEVIKVIDPVNVVLPETITEIGCEFSKCKTLESIIIPQGITEIDRPGFYGCSSLSSIVIPKSVTKIEEYAFRYCTSLSSIVIPDSMTDISNNAFEGCDKLDICWGDGLYQKDGIVYSKDKTSIVYASNQVDVVLLDSITCIDQRRFYDCISLQSIVIPDSVTEISDCAFEGCTSLESIVIPGSVTEIGEDVFEGCDNLKSITISKKIKKAIKNMDLPEGCQVIIADQDSTEATATLAPGENAVFTSEDYEKMGRPEDLEIPKGYVAIANNAFEECEDLESIVIPEGVTHIGKLAFYNCSNLESVTLPNSLETMGNFAFGGDDVCTMRRDYEYDELEEDCGVLYNIGHTNILFVCGSPLSHDIEEGTTSIGQKFNSCETLDSIDFCDSKVEELEDHAFDGCCNMESVYLNDNLKKIGSSVFYGTQISELIIPTSVTEIDKSAFAGCNSLKVLTLPEMFKDQLNEFIIDEWDEVSLADEKYEVSFH